ncbi:MAG: hypothetical protein DRJ03_00625 [Chloroflexi bacterium]|nr:MAG: hypothetical protein DRJ03_00625 [Chloroflexota bacterium]
MLVGLVDGLACQTLLVTSRMVFCLVMMKLGYWFLDKWKLFGVVALMCLAMLLTFLCRLARAI